MTLNRFASRHRSIFRSILLVAFICALAVSGAGQCLRPGVVVTKATYTIWENLLIRLADVNGDGKPDLASYEVPGKVKIALNLGGGNFAAPSTYLTGDPAHPEFGDLNGDGKPEMLLPSGTTLGIWLNDGSGSFTFLNTIDHTAYPVQVADFNGDGKGDLLSLPANANGSRLFTIRMGNGAGAFAGSTTYFVSNATLRDMEALVGDFNNDGKLDVAAGVDEWQASEKIKVFLNDGSGALTLAVTTGITASELKAVIDLNGDGKSDIVGSPPNGPTLTVMINNGSNAFTATDYAVNADPLIVNLGDFDGDTKKDLFLTYDSDTLAQYPGKSVLLGDGLGAFVRKDIAKPGWGEVLGDIDGDGKTDILEQSTLEWSHERIIYSKQTTCSAGGDPFRIDYDGDGWTEYSVFRPSNGTWYRRTDNQSPTTAIQFGASGDIPVPGDYDGDGKTDLAVFRPASGDWYQLYSSDLTVHGAHFGLSGDKPVPGDYDGDGRSDIAVYRPSGGAWYVLQSGSGSVSSTAFGISTDIPVPVDFDGDRRTDVAVFRPTEGAWYLIASATNSVVSQTWGANGDKPVAADYDGDLKADIAVFRPSNGIWYVLRSSNSALLAMQWGQAGDVPIPAFADVFNGVRPPQNAVPAVYRPSNGYFYSNAATFSFVQINGTGDIPVSAPYRVE